MPAPPRARLDAAVAAARDWLIARQTQEGFWQGELEGDTTLESYLILIEAFFNRRETDKVRDLARVIRAEALPEGGWSQYLGGPPELSVSCLSYFALKVAGESAEAPHMRAARAAIRALGGVGRANTYTRHHLAMFGQVSWESVPAIPPEMLFFPRKAPFSVYDLSAWSRTIFVPLSIIWAEKPVIALPAACGVPELLDDARELGPVDPPPAADWKTVFHGIDKLLKVGERVPGAGVLRRRAVKRAGAWMIERLAESEGLSAILPAMANSALALSLLGYSEKHPLLAEALGHLDGLLLRDEDGLRMQPCLSPVWDTVLATHALLQGSLAPDDPVDRPRRGLAARQADPTTRRLGRAQPGAARRLVLRREERVLPRRRRHLHGAHGAGPGARRRHARGARRGDAARPRLDDGDAERRRRVGQLRSRQRQAVADRRPLRRPQRHDRSQHRRHHGARARVA